MAHSRASVRKLLNELLVSDSDLDAFCLDHFCDKVYRRFASGMDRVAKLNLLLEHIEPERIVDALREEHPEAFAPAERPQTRVKTLPPAGLCLGRDTLVADLVGRLLAEPPTPTILLGTAGIGKSTLTRAALNDAKIAACFGERRFFVALDTATTAQAMAELIGQALGLTAMGDPLRAARDALRQAPAVLALDNLETPWEHEGPATESMLATLAQVPGLALVASVRGNKRPGGPAWGVAMKVEPVDALTAKDIFCSIAHEHRDHPELESLLTELEGIPLAIVLLAHVADGGNLRSVAAAWREKRTRLLERDGPKQDRLSSWKASIELSFDSLRMTEDAKRLTSLVAALPDGVAQDDLAELYDGTVHSAAGVLVRVGLASWKEDRLTMLTPIREHIRQEYPAADADLDRAMEFYGELARTLGPKGGKPGGAEAIARLTPETANLDALIRRGLAKGDAKAWIDAALALTNFARVSGRATPSPLRLALKVASTLRDEQRQANCILRLGDIALERSQHDEARSAYQRTLPLFEQVGDVLGQVNCILRLGDIALRRLQHDEARSAYQRALPLFEQMGDVLGQANCILRLGDIALERSQHDEARSSYQRALPLFEQMGDVLGQANCILRLGDIALMRSQHNEARSAYQRALPLYEQVGDVLGQANCIQSLGDIALMRLRHDEARSRYEEALALYGRIPEPYSMGMTYRRIARLTTDIAERRRHVEAARAAWTSIDRPDLVAELDEEFGKDA